MGAPAGERLAELGSPNHSRGRIPNVPESETGPQRQGEVGYSHVRPSQNHVDGSPAPGQPAGCPKAVMHAFSIGTTKSLARQCCNFRAAAHGRYDAGVALDCNLEQPGDEMELADYLTDAHPPGLPLPNRMHGFVTLDRAGHLAHLRLPRSVDVGAGNLKHSRLLHLPFNRVSRTIAVCSNFGRHTLNRPDPNPSPVSRDGTWGIVARRKIGKLAVSGRKASGTSPA